MADNLGDLRKLRTRVEQIADDLNVKVGGFTVVPGENADDNDVVTVAFFLTAESVETIEETETRKTNDEFESMFSEEFGSTLDFADDDTKKMLEAEAAKEAKMASEIERLIEDLENDD